MKTVEIHKIKNLDLIFVCASIILYSITCAFILNCITIKSYQILGVSLSSAVFMASSILGSQLFQKFQSQKITTREIMTKVETIELNQVAKNTSHLDFMFMKK